MDRVRSFKGLAHLHRSKSAKKRAQAEYDVRSAASDLTNAMHQAKNRVETEEQEGRLFYIEDEVMPPFALSERLTVRISYRWRAADVEGWVFGDIVFKHEAASEPNNMLPEPARKPTAVKRERDRQDRLYREWDRLKSLGLLSLREHFRRVGSGAEIPDEFHAKVDPHTRGVNNFSAQFW